MRWISEGALLPTTMSAAACASGACAPLASEARYGTLEPGTALRLLDRRAVLDVGVIGTADVTETVGNGFRAVPWLGFGIGL